MVLGKLPLVATFTGRFQMFVCLRLSQALWKVSFALLMFHLLLACPMCMPALIMIGCSQTIDRLVLLSLL